MSYRNSFSKCIDAMGTLFSQERYSLLHLLHNPAGKYYTVLTPIELENKFNNLGSNNSHNSDSSSNSLKSNSNMLERDGDRIVMSITRKEMRILYDKSQKDLFSSSSSEQSNNGES